MTYKIEVWVYRALSDEQEFDSLDEIKQYAKDEGHVDSWQHGECSISIFEDGERIKFEEYLDMFD